MSNVSGTFCFPRQFCLQEKCQSSAFHDWIFCMSNLFDFLVFPSQQKRAATVTAVGALTCLSMDRAAFTQARVAQQTIIIIMGIYWGVVFTDNKTITEYEFSTGFSRGQMCRVFISSSSCHRQSCSCRPRSLAIFFREKALCSN